jgi:site-specific DNA-methyltransferase (cytosine-N4-specific)
MPIYRLYFPQYELRGYERALAVLEVQRIFGKTPVIDHRTYLEVVSSFEIPKDRLERLTFFEKIDVSQNAYSYIIVPRQVFLDKSAKISRSPRTRSQVEKLCADLYSMQNGRREHGYLTHSLHQYKGKFYPQVVKALMNFALVQHGDVILDPFGGSGTTMLECYLNNLVGISVDLNPLASFIAKTKIEALSIDCSYLEQAVDDLAEALMAKSTRLGLLDACMGIGVEESAKVQAESIWPQLRTFVPYPDYLERWFDRVALCKIGLILKEIPAIQDTRFQSLCKVTLSNLLRDFSLQEPSQLRIRRRKDEAPSYRLLQKFIGDLNRNATIVYVFQSIKSLCQIGDPPWYCYCDDARQLQKIPNGFLQQDEQIDFVVTSPPYAMALPYIDTDRLSLATMGFVGPAYRSQLERQMIGNREIQPRQRKALEWEFFNNCHDTFLPDSVKALVEHVYRLNSNSSVGFRRQNMPSLLYKYFSDMKLVFQQVWRVLKPGKFFAVIIGNNHTYAGGERVDILTDQLLIDIGESIGFQMVQKMPMTDQPAYMVHSKNMVQSETIFILRKP